MRAEQLEVYDDEQSLRCEMHFCQDQMSLSRIMHVWSYENNVDVKNSSESTCGRLRNRINSIIEELNEK